ncbi:sialate O-acetylesterase [Algoriphagus resistens]|uniref:sialate O-acetylesterase n=1 Tax=Algoriphagus resistens TaxID=1750590 RepID=UPI000716AC85|nr:sialate O-acetylesterase [Algoriphagus resistens]
MATTDFPSSSSEEEGIFMPFLNFDFQFNMKATFIGFVIGISLLFAFQSEGKTLRVAPIFTDHMVLQRDVDVPIWGMAEPKAKLTVYFGGNSWETVADKGGAWQIILPPHVKGGPYSIVVRSAKSSIEFQDVWFGDVWLCSGQSNMEWTVEKSHNAESEIKAANYHFIRLFEVPHQMAASPEKEWSDNPVWKACTPETVADFSAVAYFFGRELVHELDVPIGLISANWGGTNIEAWSRHEMLTKFPFMDGKIVSRDSLDQILSTQENHDEEEKWRLSMDSLDVGEKANWEKGEIQWSKAKSVDLPGTVEFMGFEQTDGVFWFRKDFVLNEEQASGPIEIYLGKIDDEDKSYLNGELIGVTRQATVNRNYSVPKEVLRPGKNVLVVRVKDLGWSGGFKGTPENLAVHTSEGTIDLASEWQVLVGSVSLPPIPKAKHPKDLPSTLFNGMISPLIPFSLKGIIWYQGEGNASEAFSYRYLFSSMIQDWRKAWNQKVLPFYFVQLANYRPVKAQPTESLWAELRESQWEALDLPRTRMAVAIDLGEADNIHPTNKQEVGRRLALQAFEDSYSKSLAADGPLYTNHEVLESSIRICFQTKGITLVSGNSETLAGFTIAGADQLFHRAEARIESDSTVIVSSPNVTKPVSVRYAWADNPGELNLLGSNGLPAAPFRTDQWKLSSQNPFNKLNYNKTNTQNEIIHR